MVKALGGALTVQGRERLSGLLAQAGELMARHQAAAMVITSPEDVFYWSGAYIATQRVIRERIAAVILGQGRPPVFLVCDVEERRARRDGWIEDVRSYVEFRDDPIDVAGAVMREWQDGTRPVLVDTGHLVGREMERLRHALPHAPLVDCGEFLHGLRTCKSPAEVEILAHGARCTADAMLHAFRSVQPGDPVKRVLDHFATALLEVGADAVPFLSVGYDRSGEGLISLYATPGEVRLEEGMLVRLDCSGLFGGYYSDLARMAVVGRPDARQRDLYAQLIEVHTGLMEVAAPGLPIRELYQWVAGQFARRGLTFDMPHIGHSLGIAYHEHPVINRFEEQVLRPGMTMSIEPIMYLPEVGGFHIEDLIVITESGSRLLSGPLVAEMPVIGG